MPITSEQGNSRLRSTERDSTWPYLRNTTRDGKVFEQLEQNGSQLYERRERKFHSKDCEFCFSNNAQILHVETEHRGRMRRIYIALLGIALWVIFTGLYGTYMYVGITKMNNSIAKLGASLELRQVALQKSVDNLTMNYQTSTVYLKGTISQLADRVDRLEKLPPPLIGKVDNVQIVKLWSAIKDIKVQLQSLKDVLSLASLETQIEDKKAYALGVKESTGTDSDMPRLTAAEAKRLEQDLKPPKGF